jgi:hypothetical protein
MPETPPNESLDTADAVARAAHLWIRGLCHQAADDLDRQAMAGGLVAGLCERLALDPRITDLVAYVYALLDDPGAEALPVSRTMLQRPVPEKRRLAWQRGKEEAAAIVEMLSYHHRRQ